MGVMLVPSAPIRKPVLGGWGIPAILASWDDGQTAEMGRHLYLPLFTFVSLLLRKWRPSDTSVQGTTLLVPG